MEGKAKKNYRNHSNLTTIAAHNDDSLVNRLIKQNIHYENNLTLMPTYNQADAN